MDTAVGLCRQCQECPAWGKSVFADLSAEDLSYLNESKTTFAFQKGEFFSRQSEAAETVYCLASGAAKVVKDLRNVQRESIVRVAAPGDLLGYRCIFSEEKFRATAVALESGVACKMHKDTFMQVIAKNPQFAFKVLKMMGQEVASSENRHLSFSLKNTRERVAEALVVMSQRSGRATPSGVEITIKMTRSEWAEWVGVAKETLIRCFSDFKDEGWLSLDDSAIVIVDLEKLKDVACL